jgi:hypothetical protein
VRTGTAALALAAIALAGCGSSTHSSSSAATPAFAWLRPGPPPAGWPVVRIPAGAAMAYPPGWHVVAGDRGTATAVLFGAHRHYLGYLNLTPRQADETLADWGRFRVQHNAEEGDRGVVTQAIGTGLRFPAAHGSCVRDAYSSSTGARYIELACLVMGTRSSVVIVGASPPQAWGRISPQLERALSSVTT